MSPGQAQLPGKGFLRGSPSAALPITASQALPSEAPGDLQAVSPGQGSSEGEKRRCGDMASVSPSSALSHLDPSDMMIRGPPALLSWLVP